MFRNHTLTPDSRVNTPTNNCNTNFVRGVMLPHDAPFMPSSPSPHFEPVGFVPTSSPQFYPSASPQFYPSASPQFHPSASPQFYAKGSPVIFAGPASPPFYSTDFLNMPQNCNVITTPMFSPFMNGMAMSPQMMTQVPVNMMDVNQQQLLPEMKAQRARKHMSNLSLDFSENQPKTNERCLRDTESLPNPISLLSFGKESAAKSSMTLFEVLSEGSGSMKNFNQNKQKNSSRNYTAPAHQPQFRKFHSGHFVSSALDRKESLKLQKKIADAKANNDHDKFESMYYQFLPEILRLSRDQYANFVLQRLIESLRIDLVDSFAEKVKGDSVAMATNQFSCRVLQSIILNCSPKLRHEIVKNILPDAAELLRNNYGCYVLQKIIETTPSSKLQQLLNDHIIPQLFDLCVHQYSCRVVQDIFRYFPAEDKKELTQCILKNILKICSNGYGNYVVQKMIHYGNKNVSGQVCSTLLPHVVDLCCNKAGSNILEKCFAKASDEDRALLIQPIIDNRKNLKKIVQDKFGNYVLQKMLISLPYEKRIALCNALNNYFSECSFKKLNTYEKFVYQKLKQNKY